ncbi:PREDICTED: formin-like protein 5 [Amphimedon queenslandica]|nr:PREDICTED: formin-like protein 5 [Amphimedon queenslandica]|eukprot:XP_019851798.1 PREDICTED: formin-like protein 5 [Amphimedon queenslandica]
MDPAKEDMADLSLSKLTPPPTLPPAGTNGESEPISAASNNPNGKEEEEKDLGGATEMKGNCEQGTVLLSTLQDNTKQDSGNKDEPMETEQEQEQEPLNEEEEEHCKEDEEQQATEGDEPVDDNMETESLASLEHKTTPSTDVVSNNTKKKDKDLPPPPATRQMRGSRTTPTNKRTRRLNPKPEEEGKGEEDLSGSATTSGNETETDDKGKVKGGKGRGRGGISRQNMKDSKPEQSSTPEESLVKGPARKGGAGAQSYSAAYRVTRATAAAAGIKTVDFIQLRPSAQKKRKRGVDDTASDDTDQPNIKKNKGEEEENEEGLSDEESVVSNEKPAPTKDKPIPEKSAPEKAPSEKPAAKKPAPPEKSTAEDTSSKCNPRMRGRGRGKRGVAKSEQLESPSESVGGKKMKQGMKDQETCLEESEETPTKDTPTKKKRGRPKRKGKEDKETTPTQSFPNTPLVKTEEVPKGEEPQEETGSLSEPVRKEDQILGLLQLSENVESGNIDDTIPPVADHTPVSASSNDDGTSLATPTNQEVAVKQEKPSTSEDSSEKPQLPAPLVDDGNVVPISQTTPTSIPMEGPYQFPLPSRYSHDASPYPYPPHIHPSFMPPPPHSYPPFSAQHYHPFIIPTSPHFPPYPPPPHSDCLSHPLYFSDDPFGRYPPQSTAAQSPSPNVPPNPLPTSTSNKVSSPPMESPVTTSGGNNINHSHPTTPTVTTPVTHGIPLPHPLNYNPSHMPPPPHHHPGYPIPSFNFALPAPDHWSHQMPVPPGGPPTQAPPPPIPPPPPSTSSSAKKDARLPTPFVQPEETQPVTTNPVNCPECGRHFKNNKALNGHMRLHGGFDWTKRICRPYVMGAKKEDDGEGKNNPKVEPEEGGVTVVLGGGGGGRGKQNHKENKPHNKSEHLKVKEKETRLQGATLDDLCRAAEELERIDRDNSIKPRPSPLTLPHERRIASFSPPYTPPPILSPARSLVLLSGGVGGGSTGGGVTGGGIPTPNKIWPQRKGSDNKGVKDLEEPFEP